MSTQDALPLWRHLHQTRAGEARDVRGLVSADFRAFLDLDAGKERSSWRRRLDVLSLPGFYSVVLYRVSALLHRMGLTPPARLVAVIGFVLFGAEISPRMVAGPGLVIPHPQGVTLGAGLVLGSNVRLLRGVAMGTVGRRDPATDGFPVIGDDCVLCDSATVFGPVEVGAGSVLGAGVTLFESVPPRSIVSFEQVLKVRSRDRGDA